MILLMCGIYAYAIALKTHGQVKARFIRNHPQLRTLSLGNGNKSRSYSTDFSDQVFKTDKVFFRCHLSHLRITNERVTF